MLLFSIVFFWTPPHFWALSLLMKDEYAKVGVPMLPVVRGEDETRRQILLYTVLLYAVTQLPFCAGGFGTIYLVASMLLGSASSPARSPAIAGPTGAARCGCTCSRCLPRAAVLRDGRGRPSIECAPADVTRRLARKNIRTGLIVGGICMFMFGITFVVAALYVSWPARPRLPPVGEEIHLPGPSILPLLTRRHHARAGGVTTISR